jgi:autotransporter-associated beta strand protein
MTVSLNPTAGTFLVSSTTGTNATGKAELRLADTTTITANALTVGGAGAYNGNADQVNLLKLGAVSNVLNVNSLNIGTGARDLGSITFLDTTGTVTVRAADGTSAAAFNMGTGTATTAALLIGNQNTFDVTGHDADLKFSTVSIGTQNRGADLANVFSFDTGTLEIGSLNASSKGSNGFTTTTTINLGGGTVSSGAWTLATASGAGSAVATANLTGGDITFSGNISRGADAVGGGTATGTVNLDGANLNMGGNIVGSSTNQIVFNAMSGTLSGLAELNGGGALTKTTAGTLIMGSANAYTGATNVNDGILQVGVAGVGTTGTGLITAVKVGATYADAPVISGSGSLQGSVIIGDVTNAANRGILSPGDANHTTNNATLTITATGGLTIAAGSQTRLGITSATGMDSVFASSGLTASAYLASLSSTSDGVFGTAPSAWFTQPSGGAADFLNLTSGTGTLTLGSNAGMAAAGEGIVSIFNNGLNVGTLTAGQIFNLVDWYGAFSGSFNAGTFSAGGVNGDFDLPDISSSGFTWDTSAFTSHGVLAVSAFVIPEPSRAMLLLFGFLLLTTRRRRVMPVAGLRE